VVRHIPEIEQGLLTGLFIVILLYPFVMAVINHYDPEVEILSVTEYCSIIGERENLHE